MSLKILFLGANPRDTTRIRIDEELREIDQQLRLSSGRDRLSLGQKWAVRPDDLQQSLVDNEPQIVHFSGHGSSEGISLEDEQGNSKEVNAEALSDLFALFKGSVKCVVLNACYSEAQAAAINLHIPYVIGMSSAMPDDAALHFSVGFYKAIAAGKTVEFAFNLGVNAIKLEGLAYDKLPKLLKTSDNLVLLEAAASSNSAANTVLNTENSTTSASSTFAKFKWWVYGGIMALVAGIAGYFYGENKPQKSLEYRISNATMDIYEASTDSFKLTFDVVADNNTLKANDFIRDSFSLQLPNSDAVLKPLKEGKSRVSIKRNENVSVKVAFCLPFSTRSGNLGLNIGRPNGAVHIDYFYSAPMASNDIEKEKNKPEPAPIVISSDKDLTSLNDAEKANNALPETGKNISKQKTTTAVIRKKPNTTTPPPLPVPMPTPLHLDTAKTIKKPNITKINALADAVVIVSEEGIQEGKSVRLKGGAIKCDPKLVRQMQEIKSLKWEQK